MPVSVCPAPISGLCHTCVRPVPLRYFSRVARLLCILLIFNDLRKVVFRALKDRVLADERWLFAGQKAVSWPGMQLWRNG